MLHNQVIRCCRWPMSPRANHKESDAPEPVLGFSKDIAFANRENRLALIHFPRSHHLAMCDKPSLLPLLAFEQRQGRRQGVALRHRTGRQTNAIPVGSLAPFASGVPCETELGSIRNKNGLYESGARNRP
jgi:hypothetical protein